jgi:hypothetical protein
MCQEKKIVAFDENDGPVMLVSSNWSRKEKKIDKNLKIELPVHVPREVHCENFQMF